MDNTEAAAHYRSVPICLNHHRTTRDYGSGQHIDRAYSLGPRAYEIAACGGFQLMDASRPEAEEVFGGSLVTYRDSEDLERQIHYWLAHPAERAAKAAAQHAHILAHSWTARAGAVLDVLQEHLWQPSTA
jgi:spore maturation protein CgeB